MSEQGASVRRRMLAAAVELIPELGWTGVSTRVLAARAGVAPGLVHYHFESLQALLRRAAVTAMRETLAQGMAQVPADAPRPVLQSILGFLDSYSGSDATSLLFIEASLAATRDPELRRELMQVLDEFRSALAAQLTQDDGPEPEDTAAVVAAALDGLMLHRVLDPTLTASRVGPVLERILH